MENKKYIVKVVWWDSEPENREVIFLNRSCKGQDKITEDCIFFSKEDALQVIDEYVDVFNLEYLDKEYEIDIVELCLSYKIEVLNNDKEKD